MPPISFGIIPGSDGVLLLGLPTLKDLGVDPYERIWDSMQQRVSPPNQGVETTAVVTRQFIRLPVTCPRYQVSYIRLTVQQQKHLVPGIKI